MPAAGRFLADLCAGMAGRVWEVGLACSGRGVGDSGVDWERGGMACMSELWKMAELKGRSEKKEGKKCKVGGETMGWKSYFMKRWRRNVLHLYTT